ncbi:MAG: hypothetical protein IJV40_10995 [Oscillospiraceae bacterium]|nr:hypothetical protein [Oscillospiraceae bacterium]
MVTNITHVSFGDQRFKKTKKLWQWNRGQVLVFDDIDLPDSYTARICNTGEPNTKTQIGTAADGLKIPNVYLEDGRDIDIYIYLHATEDDGETEYHIHIPVIQQPPPLNITPDETEQGIIDQAIAALNAGAEKAEGDALDAEAWAKGTRAGEPVDEEDETYHNNAAYFAGLTGADKQAAEGAVAAAVAAQGAAETARDESVTAKNDAVQAKNEAVAAKDEAQQLVNGAVTTVNQARDAAVEAVNTAGTTQTANAKAEADRAAQKATDAAASAAAAVDAKNAAETAQGLAEGAQRAAENAAGNAETAKGGAEDAANEAQAASAAVQNMSVSASTLAAGSPATVQKTVDQQTGAVNLAFGIPQGLPGEGVNTYHYGARWNKTTHSMERTGSAAQITKTLTNFAHRGSINANYNNPFDSIYPWSGCKLCNIDIDAYRALAAGQSVRDCIIAWEGDPDFSYTHENGVWKYRPEFYGTSYDGGDGYRYFDITDKPLAGYVHYPEDVIGRWRGIQETRQIDGADKIILLPKPGMPCKRVAMSTIHTYAKNWGATLDNIFCLDGSILMFIIEYADFNCQSALGNGVSALYKEGEDHFTADATDSTQVRVTASAAALVIPGAIFDIGTAKAGVQVGSYYVVSVETDGTDKVVTLDRAVTVTTAHFWSIHGRVNIADEEIGSMSGYIGTNGQSDCYYRGEVFWGNIWLYVLGAYHQANTNHVWLAKSAAAADNYDAINTGAHIDTGVELSATNGYIKELGFLNNSGVLSVPIFCTVVGGTSDNPVGDYFYISVASNTVLLFGGGASYGTHAGFYAPWNHTAGRSFWNLGGRPHLKSP